MFQIRVHTLFISLRNVITYTIESYNAKKRKKNLGSKSHIKGSNHAEDDRSPCVSMITRTLRLRSFETRMANIPN